MAKADLDRSQLDRQLLGDLAALMAADSWLASNGTHGDERARIEKEIRALVKELWPTG